MNVETKIKALKKLINKYSEISTHDANSLEFICWKHLVERTLIAIYGDNSIEINHFYGLHFSSGGLMARYRSIHEKQTADRQKYEFSTKILLSSILEYIEEIQDSEANTIKNPLLEIEPEIQKVFISHSIKDKDIVIEFVDLLESIGMQSTQIFCTSVDEYSIPIGDNYLDALKNEIKSNTLVIFVMSQNFSDSSICLCEMGAAWALSKRHVPVLIPPFDYKDMEGVIPLTQGLKINESAKLNILKEQLENLFNLETRLNQTTWERKRDRFTQNINKLIK